VANVNVRGVDLSTGKTRSILSTDVATDNEGTPIAGSGSFSTVASSDADYTSVKAALDDSKTKILITGSITEAVTIVPSNVDIYIELDPQVTWTFGSNIYFNGSGTYTSNLTIELNDSTIVYARTTATASLFDIGASGSIPIVTFKGHGTITNNSTSTTSSYLVDPTTSYEFYMIGSFTFNTPNVTDSGISLNDAFFVNDLTIVGGGAACKMALISSTTSRGAINQLTFEGTYNTGASNQICDLTDPSGQENNRVGNLILDLASTSYLDIGWTIANVVEIASASNPNFQLLEGAIISGGSIITAGTIEVADGVIITNTDLNMSALNISSSITGFRLTDCRGASLTDDLSVGGPFTLIMGCNRLGDITVSSTGDNSQIIGNKCGSSGTITIDSGCNGCIAVGNQVDVAISDSGTGSVVANNNTY
jgi:hypothetical protein